MRIVDVIRIIALALCALLFAWMVTSCKTQDCVPETIIKDSIRVEFKHDSIYRYERDSIYIHQKADTVWMEKYITRYKDVMKIERDTIWKENKVVEVKEVEVEKPIAGITKWFAWIGAAALLYALGRIGLWVYRKFFLKV